MNPINKCWLVLFVFVIAPLSAALARDLQGRARILDGDTLVIAAQPIRLFGIDAPENDQLCTGSRSELKRCGIEAKRALSDFIANQPIHCSGTEFDRYNRLIATCLRDGQDIARWLVLVGHAVAFRRYSSLYVADERKAEGQRAGMWAGAVY